MLIDAHAHVDRFEMVGEGVLHGKKPGNPAACGGGNGPASQAYGCVKPRLAFSLESPLAESGG